jgi:hypothetical protein
VGFIKEQQFKLPEDYDQPDLIEQLATDFSIGIGPTKVEKVAELSGETIAQTFTNFVAPANQPLVKTLFTCQRKRRPCDNPGFV